MMQGVAGQAGRGVALTMGFSKKGKPCMERSALVAAATSANTIHACPRSRKVFKHTTSRIFPNWENMPYRHFLSSARASGSVHGVSIGEPGVAHQKAIYLHRPAPTFFVQLFIHIVHIEGLTRWYVRHRRQTAKAQLRARCTM